MINIPTFKTKNNELYIDGKKVIKAYESFSGWYWFATEKAETQDSVIDGKVYENDTIWFGFEEEWGYFSQAEIESLKLRTWEIKKEDLAYAGRKRE